jgi:predicted RNase H-like nuclease (RuvC/YqgF family)
MKTPEEYEIELLEKEMNMKDKGPNDLEWIINKLHQQNYKLEMEVEMLKRDIAFLQEELQAEKLRNEFEKTMRGGNNDTIKLQESDN